MKKRIAMALILIVMAAMLAGCNQAALVSYNLSKEANQFNVTRRLAVINARTDKPLFEMVGNFSISNSDYSELEITVQTGPKEYKKHFV